MLPFRASVRSNVIRKSPFFFLLFQLLIIDNHGSHFSVDVLDKAKDNNVTILCLPSHTTHLAQPLDVAVFSAMKGAYNKVCAASRLLKADHRLRVSDFSKFFKEVFLASMTPSNIVAGFCKTGIWPFNKMAITASSMAPAAVYAQHCDGNGSSDSSSSDAEKEEVVDDDGKLSASEWTEGEHTLNQKR